MTQLDRTADIPRLALDRTRSGRQAGSIGLVLFLGLALLGAGGGLLFAGHAYAEPYLFALTATLAMAGVFLLLALATGILGISDKAAASPLIKSVVDRAPDGILVTDAGGRVIYANAAYLDLTEAADPNDARPVERAFGGDPGVSEAVYRLLRAAREGRRLQEEVRLGGRGGGEARWLRLRVRPLGEGRDAPGLTVWTIADVTRELVRQENVFQELQTVIDYLDHAPAGFFSVDANGDIGYVNATLAEWLGYEVEEIATGSLKLGDLVAGEGTALLTTLSAAPGEVRTDIFDLDLKTRGGRTLPVRLFHKVAFAADGNPGASRTLVLNRARDNGSDPQRLAEVRFMRFFNNTPMAIATVDQPGRIVRSNAAFARLFGPVRQAEGPQGASILSVVAERDRAALETAIRKAADKQGEIAPVDAALTGSGERYARFYVTAVAEEEGDREAAIVYGMETTEQRALESQFTQAQKMELVGKLAGGIAHDFNNVLGAIIMATDFLVNAHKPTDPSFQDIMQIRQNANRAAGLVRHLLAFSRKQTLRPQVLDPGEAVSDLTMLLRRLIGENVTLNVAHGRDLWPIKADIAQLEQVIVNLAVNARDAMPDGGRLTLKTGNVSAQDSTRYRYKGMPVGEYVLIEVADTGTGIAPEIVDKIFDPFFTTKEVNKGTGLGLSTVYGIVKQTGGFIYFDSTVGKGTTFRIFLPRYIAGADDLPQPLPETASPALAGTLAAAEEVRRTATDLTGQGTILLVEDEEGLRTLNARGLASRGYKVIEAGNGVEAIEALQREAGRVDLVVSDVVMPEMDGPTLLKEMRKTNPELRIIFVSGYAEDAFEKGLSDSSQYNFLPKPFTLKQLVSAVKEAMGR